MKDNNMWNPLKKVLDRVQKAHDSAEHLDFIETHAPEKLMEIAEKQVGEKTFDKCNFIRDNYQRDVYGFAYYSRALAFSKRTDHIVESVLNAPQYEADHSSEVWVWKKLNHIND